MQLTDPNIPERTKDEQALLYRFKQVLDWTYNKPSADFGPVPGTYTVKTRKGEHYIWYGVQPLFLLAGPAQDYRERYQLICSPEMVLKSGALKIAGEIILNWGLRFHGINNDRDALRIGINYNHVEPGADDHFTLKENDIIGVTVKDKILKIDLVSRDGLATEGCPKNDKHEWVEWAAVNPKRYATCTHCSMNMYTTNAGLRWYKKSNQHWRMVDKIKRGRLLSDMWFHAPNTVIHYDPNLDAYSVEHFNEYDGRTYLSRLYQFNENLWSYPATPEELKGAVSP